MKLDFSISTGQGGEKSRIVTNVLAVTEGSKPYLGETLATGHRAACRPIIMEVNRG